MKSVSEKYFFMILFIIAANNLIGETFYNDSNDCIMAENHRVRVEKIAEQIENFNYLKGENSYLTGNWVGYRDKLIDKGFKFDVLYRGDLFSIRSGNVPKKSFYLDNFDITLNTDFKKLTGWNGALLFFHGIVSHGGDPAETAGVKQGISNIAAPDAWKVFQLFIEQKLFNDKISVLFGLMDINAQYDVKMVETLFLNPSRGIGSEFAQSGKNGPSIFPVSSLGIRLRATPFKNNYVQVAILDGVPGNPDNPYSTEIILDKNDGLLVCGELGFVKGNKHCIISGDEADEHEPYTKLSIGTWFYSKGITHALSQTENWGFYLLLEQDILPENEDHRQGLSVTGRLGIANDEVNQFDNFVGGSIIYTGLFDGLDFDQIGFAFSLAHNSYLHRKQWEIKGFHTDDFEKIFELTYKYYITKFITFQPNLQYVVSPALLSHRERVLLIGSRLSLVF